MSDFRTWNPCTSYSKNGKNVVIFFIQKKNSCVQIHLVILVSASLETERIKEGC